MIVQYTSGLSTAQMDSIAHSHTSCTTVQVGDQDGRQRRTGTSPAQQGSKTLPAMASTTHFNSGRTHSTCTCIRQHRLHRPLAGAMTGNKADSTGCAAPPADNCSLQHLSSSCDSARRLPALQVKNLQDGSPHPPRDLSKDLLAKHDKLQHML